MNKLGQDLGELWNEWQAGLPQNQPGYKPELTEDGFYKMFDDDGNIKVGPSVYRFYEWLGKQAKEKA